MKFTLKVIQGDAITLMEMEAGNALQARSLAEQQGHHVLSVNQHKAGPIKFNLAGLKKTKFNVMLFSQELLALIESGLSLVEAIEALAEKETHAESKAVLNQIKASLFDGQPLSASLEKVPGVFSHFILL